ncbi:MAG: CapA family protein [Lentisphaeria bacterium]|nr:CapA family protein [Lentisphaeria bacterium]
MLCRFALTAVSWCLPLACGWPVPGIAAEPDADDVYTREELPPVFVQDEPHRRTIVLVGDIMPWDRSRANLEKHGPGYPYAATRDLLWHADLAVGNLEGPVATRAEPTKGTYRYKIPPSVLPGLRDSGLDLLSLANNHVMDCGDAGLRETLDYLREASLSGFGAGRNQAEACAPVIVRIGDTRVAFVAALCPETYFDDWEAQDAGDYERYLGSMQRILAAAPDDPGTVVATPASVAWLVRNAAAQADVVVACLHFGIRYSRPPTPRQRRLAQIAVQAGADLVVGHHAHVWQPVEVFQGVPILYGLGNFAFGSANRRADEGLLARATLVDHRLAGVEFFPLCTKNRDPDVDYQSKVFEEKAAREVVGELARLSRPFRADIRFAAGRGVLVLPERRP